MIYNKIILKYFEYVYRNENKDKMDELKQKGEDFRFLFDGNTVMFQKLKFFVALLAPPSLLIFTSGLLLYFSLTYAGFSHQTGETAFGLAVGTIPFVLVFLIYKYLIYRADRLERKKKGLDS